MSVEPEHSGSQPQQRSRRPLSLRLGVLLAVGLAVVIFVAVQPEEDGEVTTGSEPESTVELPTTSTIARAETVPLAQLVPDLTGTLYAIEGSGRFNLTTWDTTGDVLTRMTLPDGWPGDLEFDASGDLFALALENRASGSASLYVGSAERLVSTGLEVTSFTWHQTEPGAMAVVLRGPEGGPGDLVTFQVEGVGNRANTTTIRTSMGPDDLVLAWGDWGFLIRRYVLSSDNRFVALVDQEGNNVWVRTAHWAYVSPTQDILLSFYDNVIRELRWVRPETAQDDPGAWFEVPSVGVAGIAWSPGGDRIALATYAGGDVDFRLDLYTRDGVQVDNIRFEWKVWDVEWSPDGRFLLMPGTKGSRDFVILFYDTLTGRLTPVEFDVAIQTAVIKQ